MDDETEKEMEQDGVRPVKINEDKIDEEDDSATEKEMEQDGVRPVKINEDKIDEEDDSAGETDELLDRKAQHIDIVAIAVRKKGTSEDSNEEDGYESSSNYSSVCHTLGLYIYALCFLVLAAVILKRCFKPVYSVPVMNLTEEQCAMIHRCAHQMKNSKDIAIYENDMAYV
ncbi:hypothetical protein OESDEN_00125 [Oesophagostomum dentatum]|uniref:Uncharacterized protein n=1 Tax=Oesophagostomum dentatum TaxID=61180 RepID=A0A0B1TUM6_OESDE|nr:hypothetical protein OESDEN_00125 [Oesophagostomum dentatum]